MSKFFTPAHAPWMAWLWWAVAFGEMSPPAPDLEGPGSPPPGASGLPATLQAGRFSALAKKSPFTLASTTEENADFAKDLVLGGYFRMDGKDFVMVANRTRPERLMVGTEPSPSAQGLTLVKVERDPSGDPTKLRALIRKGGETAMLKYEVASAAAAAGQPPQAPVPGQPQTQGQVQPVPGAPGQKPGQNPPVIRRRVLPVPALGR